MAIVPEDGLTVPCQWCATVNERFGGATKMSNVNVPRPLVMTFQRSCKADGDARRCWCRRGTRPAAASGPFGDWLDGALTHLSAVCYLDWLSL